MRLIYFTAEGSASRSRRSSLRTHKPLPFIRPMSVQFPTAGNLPPQAVNPEREASTGMPIIAVLSTIPEVSRPWCRESVIRPDPFGQHPQPQFYPPHLCRRRLPYKPVDGRAAQHRAWIAPAAKIEAGVRLILADKTHRATRLPQRLRRTTPSSPSIYPENTRAHSAARWCGSVRRDLVFSVVCLASSGEHGTTTVSNSCRNLHRLFRSSHAEHATDAFQETPAAGR